MVILSMLEQGDIIKIENVKGNVLVVSKDFFNKTDTIIGCPIERDSFEDALHMRIQGDEISGVVLCEHMRLFDMNVRGYTKIDRVKYEEIIDITDAIQSIFDYV